MPLLGCSQKSPELLVMISSSVIIVPDVIEYVLSTNACLSGFGAVPFAFCMLS